MYLSLLTSPTEKGEIFSFHCFEATPQIAKLLFYIIEMIVELAIVYYKE